MQETISVLKQFDDKPLYDACCDLLHYFKISFNEVTADPIPFEQLYAGALHAEMPKGLKDVVDKVESTYYIGQIDDESLLGQGTAKSNEEVESLTISGKYSGMMVFAVDIPVDHHITRSEMAVLTRGFNRTVSAQPVIIIIRQGNTLALSTCERMEYTQQWRDGEKLGKVSILRNINCLKPHRGHIDILEELGKEKYTTFDALYKHWMEVFSSELLTKKFYGELSDWYAWAIQIVRFPNDITSASVDKPMNDMAVIRMITRLIFVWFLYCKRLIPKEFFDVDFIREHFIDEFAPEGDAPLMYDPKQSRYYRAILQNLFFAMLNRPIVAEGKDIANNRRFMPKQVYHGMNPGYNVNNLMRYRDDIEAGGADEFLKLANSRVPFLNGGLFDCLDDKPLKKYYDGFSENKASLTKLQVPDYLFFGGTDDADLSGWYNDKKKKHVQVEGLIDIFHRYYFTIEENTPLDQDVSLDPELLGKVFENLLAAYVPETGSNARKQTGSFYTPREEVQYMVVESLVAHLKRMCGEENEKIYRALLSYSDEEVILSDELRKNIMLALYNCRVLDPACGSGAFPMGMLQMMVHVLRRIDPDNKMWHDLMVDQAMAQAQQAFETNDDDERKERLDDIENAFNRSINDPDYARKLYLIEHCIYGVDIQPIAIQISKLRFFISLIVDQRPTDDVANNFGIRPLPNLEANFVAANTLIPVNYDSSLVDGNPQVQKYKKELKELNHKVFLAGRNYKKAQLKNDIKRTRTNLAKAIENTGFVLPSVSNLLASWDMFDQNASASFFDPEWMFGVKGGFDIVISNPPYVVVPKKSIYIPYFKTKDCYEMYAYFYEKGINLLVPKGVITFITASLYIKGIKFEPLRKYLQSHINLISLKLAGDDVFENVEMPTAILVGIRETGSWHFADMIPGGHIIAKMDASGYTLEQISKIQRGFEIGRDKVLSEGDYPLVTGSDVAKYTYVKLRYISVETYNRFAKDDFYYTGPRLLIRETGRTLTVLYLEDKIYSNRSLYSIKIKDDKFLPKYVLACLNSKACQFYYQSKFKSDTELFPKIRIKQAKMLPIPYASKETQEKIEDKITSIIERLNEDINTNITFDEARIDIIVYHLYGLTYDEVLIVDPQTPITREEYDKEGSSSEA